MSQAVHDMFQRIAGRYDAANDVLSLGIHRLWRHMAVSSAGVRPGDRVLDVCTGTGDLAFQFLKAVGAHGAVTGVDFVCEMLELAKEKQKSSSQKVEFIQGDALSLPFDDCTFDIVSVAFGIRNVDDPVRALKEFRRVLRPRGQVVVLEFGQPSVPGFKQLYQLYSRYIMPQVGGLISGDKSAYEYLPETSARFPCGKNFVKLLREAGYWSCSSKPLSGGIAYLYRAIAQ